MQDTDYRSLYAAHVQQNQASWEAALEALDIDSVLIHSGQQILPFLDDNPYPFRANPHFLAWLPLTEHPECVLWVRPAMRPVLWYYQPDDYWHLPPADPEPWWADHFEVRVVSDPLAWEAAAEVAAEADSSRLVALGDAPSLRRQFAESAINPAGLLQRLHELRTRKTPYELACMRRASRVAARAHRAAEQAFAAGRSEFDIHLAYLAAARATDAELPYHSIIGLNQHPAALHYQARDRAAPDRARSFLIDAGANFNGYAADITRTYSADEGLFRELLRDLDQVQQRLCEGVRLAHSYPALHLEAHEALAGLLQRHGIIRCAAQDAVENGLSSVFFPHGLGHFIGLQVHDVAGLVDTDGNEIARPEGHPYLRLTRELELDNVLTIEPGVYFIDSLLAECRAGPLGAEVNWERVESLRPYGGVRIEDNVRVTGGAPENLTRAAFDEIA